MIAIKNMEMPKSCLDCPISHVDEIDYYICGEIGKNVYLYANEIHPDCPLVEIVTCKDCKHRDKVHPFWLSNKKDEVYFCTLQSDEYCYEVEDDFYCKDAERKE